MKTIKNFKILSVFLLLVGVSFAGTSVTNAQFLDTPFGGRITSTQSGPPNTYCNGYGPIQISPVGNSSSGPYSTNPGSNQAAGQGVNAGDWVLGLYNTLGGFTNCWTDYGYYRDPYFTSVWTLFGTSGGGGLAV